MSFNFLDPNKIILGLLPYWTPLIPPTGIATLKSFLEKEGYKVWTVDANVEESFKGLYNRYFGSLSRVVPREKRGNFYNVGHNVLENHMMACMHCQNRQDEEYIELVKILIEQTFFVRLDDNNVKDLDAVVAEILATLKRYLADWVEKEKPGTIGFTVYSHTLAASMFAYRFIKKKYTGIRTIMGGGVFADQFPDGSPDFEFFLEKTRDYVDKIIIGEGQVLMLKFLRGELSSSRRVFTLKDIGAAPLDFSLVDVPDLSDYNLDYYPYIAVTGSISCPNQCSFCTGTIFSGKYRQKEAKQTVAEMIHLYHTYGKRIFFMTDALLNPIISDLARELIENDISLYFDGYFRVDEAACDIKNTMLWRRAGFYRARLGIESGSQHVLDLIGKGISVEQSKAVCSALAYAGIKTTAYIVIGHPGETEEDFKKTLDFVEESRDDIYEVECNPFAYYYSGQPDSDRWAGRRSLLYPARYRELLVTSTWIVDCPPSREEVYNRLNKMTRHCEHLGIPNPYSLQDIHNADERWQRLHQHAVPAMIEFLSSQKGKACNDKGKREIVFARETDLEDVDFGF